MDVLYDFLISRVFVSVYCTAIFLLFVWWLKPFFREARTLMFQLREATAKLRIIEGEQGLVKHFEEYNEYAEGQFGRVWAEFVEMLVLPAPGSSDPIRNTSEVSKYLNESTIIFPKVPLRFLHSVPNLLMGLGIFGTFLGLAAGVGTADAGLSSGDPNEITESLEQLLSGASLAFFSSIVGIFLSLIFVCTERNRSRKLQLELRNWVDELEKRMLLVTVPSIALEQLKQAELATQQLERFNTELVYSIESALDEKIAGRLVPHLERLVESMEGIRSDRSSDAGRMIEQSLSQFTAAMQERTGSQFEEMASVVSTLNSTLKDASDGFAQTQQSIHTTMGTVIANVKASLDDTTSSMTRTLKQSLSGVTEMLSNSSRQAAEQMVASSNAAAEELRATLSDLTRELATTSSNAAAQIAGSLHGLQEAAERLERSTQQSEKVLTSMTNFVSQLNDLSGTISSSHRQMITISAQLERATLDMQAASEKSANALEQTSRSVDGMGMLIQRLEECQGSTANAWTQYQERFEGLDSSLARVFRQIDEGLSRYCEQVGEFSSTLDRTAADAIKNLASAIGEFNDSIEDLIPRLPNNSP